MLDRRRTSSSYEEPQLPPSVSKPAHQGVAPTENFDAERMSGRIYTEEAAGARAMYAEPMDMDDGVACKFESPDRSISGPVD